MFSASLQDCGGNTHPRADCLGRKRCMKMKPIGTVGWTHCSPDVKKKKKRHIPPILPASFALQLNTARDLHGDRTSPCAHFPSLPFFPCVFVRLFVLFSYFSSAWSYVPTSALGGRHCSGLSIHGSAYSASPQVDF